MWSLEVASDNGYAERWDAERGQEMLDLAVYAADWPGGF